MAQEFKLLYVLWLVACLGTITSEPTVITTPPTTIITETTTTTETPPTTITTETTTTTETPPTTITTETTTTTETPPTTITTETTTTTETPPTTITTETTTTTETPPTTITTETTTTTETPPTTITTETTTTTETPPTTITTETTTTTETPPTTITTETTTTTETPPTTITTETTTTTKTPPTTITTETTTTTETPPTTITTETTTTTKTPPTTTAAQTPLETTVSSPTATTTNPTTTKPLGPCDTNPCGRGSTCEVRANQTFVCLCLVGEIYNDERNSCETAKVFPGQLNLPSLTYNVNMSDKKSQKFNETSNLIINEMSNIYSKSDGYTGTIVLELLPSSSSKVVSDSKGVSASIEIAFSEKSDITTEEVKKNMSRAQSCDKCLFANSSFAVTDMCNKGPCDGDTTNCTSQNGLYTCTCEENYIRTNFSVRMCIACPSGQKAQDSIKCVNCPFGYSGFNCSESWQLVLVIVGSVLGGLLLITLILLPVVATKTSKKSSKNDTNADTGKPYNSNSPAKAPLVNNDFAASKAHSVNGSSFTNPGVPIFPRATTTSNSRTNLEMTPSNSQQTLISADRKSRLYDNQDDLYPYSQSRPQTRGYVQVLPQNNPYAQNQPRINPYAQSQGRTNSYYMHND